MSVGGCGTYFWKEFVSRSAAAGHIFGEKNRTSVGGCGTHFWSIFPSEKNTEKCENTILEGFRVSRQFYEIAYGKSPPLPRFSAL